MRVLLAGATGVIGRQTVPVLTAAGHQVTGLAVRPAHLPGARVVAQGVAYAYDPAGSPVKDEDAPRWRHPPAQFVPVLAALGDMERQVTGAGGLVLRLGQLYGPGTTHAPEGGFTRHLRAGKVPVVGALNIVDDQPTLVREWLPDLGG